MNRRIFTLSIYLATLATTLQAQEGNVASGGLATGSMGSVSYSVGQIFYIGQSSEFASISPGVQQPFSVTPLGISERNDLQISIGAFPNPASENLTITVSGQKTENMTCRIYDLRGKHVDTFQIRAGLSQINIRHLTNAIYLFAFTQDDKTIQTFKIVKTH